AFSDGASAPRLLVAVRLADGDVRTLPADSFGDATEGRFSPDGRQLAFTVIGEGYWQLRMASLDVGGERVLQEGTTTWQEGADPPFLPLPLAWTPAGVLVQEVLWGTDAPPRGVALVAPADGAVTARVAVEHLAAYPSPDGARVALVTGIAPIADQPRQGVVVAELPSGRLHDLAAEAPQLVKALHFSPDERRVLYSLSARYDSPVTTLRTMRLEGAGAQAVDFGVSGFRLALRDIAWADDGTPLVLVSNLEAGRVELHALPLDSFDATGLRPLGEFPRPTDEHADVRILYVPR
ncbi:MAG TPA: hypothetical protein VNL77_24950, partial [Roseiflexaceae bacterium]|nr:hypothetical protein [Roseiflexaceae bacterium]